MVLSGARRDVGRLLRRRLVDGPLDATANTFRKARELDASQIAEQISFL